MQGYVDAESEQGFVRSRYLDPYWMEGDAGPSTSIYLETGYLEKTAYGFRVTGSWEFSQSFERVWRMSAGGRPRNGLFLVQR